MCAASVTDHEVIFTARDVERRYSAVGLDCDEAIAGGRRFRRTAAGWRLAIPRPALQRMEYRLALVERNGSTHVLCDSLNAERVRTAFGERSVVLLPGYRRPDWLGQARTREGSTVRLVHASHELGDIPMTVWTPTDVDASAPAPLLVAHDGPEYAELAQLVDYSAAMIASSALPPFRIALMHPVERDAWYSANPAYLAASHAALDELERTFPSLNAPVVLGASLGGLSAVLAASAAESRFGGVVSQSGSFFQPRLDDQESSYPFFDRVTAAVHDVLHRPRAARQLVVGMTCGALEENLANNRDMAAALQRQGHEVTFRVVPDLHNYTAWRDGLHPTLTEVLRSVWGAR
ncbi:MAG: alpha/beta hydrolase-fold protein [Nocardioidaceae bacterium]